MRQAGPIMSTVLRLSFVSLMVLAGCVTERAEAPDRDAPDKVVAVSSQAVDKAAPPELGALRVEPSTCAPRVCTDSTQCTCFNTQCVNNVCRTILFVH